MAKHWGIWTRIRLSFVMLVVMLVAATESTAQKDTVHLQADADGRRSQVRGKIVEMSPFQVVVDDDGDREEVPVSRIAKITFGGEPRDLTRAREHLNNARYDDCLEAFEKIDELPDGKYIQQEIQFLIVFAQGMKALRGDKGSTIEAAENQLAAFIKANSDSYQLARSVDLHGQLLMAEGKAEQAGREFNRLTRSGWTRYQLRGHFYEGETLIHQGEYARARESFEAVIEHPVRSDESTQLKLLAQCQLARIDALEGGIESAIATLEGIIQNEDSDNTRLFAHAYNALGTAYLQAGQWKKACRAFLHTELLFPAEREPHAESLYQLSKIWAELKETDRANRARQTLISRYRNTIWARKL